MLVWFAIINPETYDRNIRQVDKIIRNQCRLPENETQNSVHSTLLYLVGAFQVGALAGQRHLDGRWALGNKVHQLALANALQRLVNL